MNVLHTEASSGFGGQEMRILCEAEGLRARGHQVIMVVRRKGGLVAAARAAGFQVYELAFERRHAAFDLIQLIRIIKRHKIEIVNTHSSWDAWLAGIAARLTKRKILRTRHLSTAIKPGLNSRVLYGWLADQVVTTCEQTAQVIRRQAGLCDARCRSIPTGVSTEISISDQERALTRLQFGLSEGQIVVGTVCVLRSWKGVQHLLEAAALLRDVPQLRWLIVGDGPAKDYLKDNYERLKLGASVIFTGYQANPMRAIAAMDIFALLSMANEGVSQAVLQAAYLGKPLVTTPVGGLSEVCIDGHTGILCPVASPEAVAQAIRKLIAEPQLRTRLGAHAKQHVLENFTLDHTLRGMENVYRLLQEA